MPELTLDRRTIPGFVQYAGERSEPPLYLRPVDGDYAQPLGAACRYGEVIFTAIFSQLALPTFIVSVN
ncbi:hypothetical protein FIA78_21055 [Escherichia coli]|nr:hypothetical protein [Escherichia coli]EFI5498533.1 hypothetical protein [Escherichia coli]EFI8160769.1 hypothetical protein [Escherichia coli]EFI8994055.1 hypothetical protein [Escherichia coli]EFJ1110523.1 hypothetical protein [Escherichia coli]